MTLSIPQDKLADVLKQVREVHDNKYITKRKLQSLLGSLLFVAKCVRPARTFVSRILNALREAKTDRIYIDSSFRADLSWFLQFCSEWNGVAIIPQVVPSKVILVDACLSGIGGTDGQYAYSAQLTQADDGVINITEMEMVNVVIAIHTLLSQEDRGKHIRIRCDNQAAVSVLQTGKANNPILQDCARAVWMTQALLGVEMSYDHIPGRDNNVADALSRAHLSMGDRDSADRWIAHYALETVRPCLFYMLCADPPISSRSGAPLAPPESDITTRHGARTGNPRQSLLSSQDVHRLHGHVRGGPTGPINSNGVCIPGVHGRAHTRPRDHQKQGLTRPDVPSLIGPHYGPNGPPQGQDGSGSVRKGQDVRQPEEVATASGRHGDSTGRTPRQPHWSGRQSGHPHHILWNTATIRGRPYVPQIIRQAQTSNPGRLQTLTRLRHPGGKMGEEPPKSRTEQVSNPSAHRHVPLVPGSSCTGEHYGGPDKNTDRTAPNVPGHTQADPSVPHKKDMGQGADSYRYRHSKVLAAQPTKDICHPSTLARLHRDRNTGTRGVEVRCLQTVYRHPNWQGYRRPDRLFA